VHSPLNAHEIDLPHCSAVKTRLQKLVYYIKLVYYMIW
jgi:hypothetical protein